MQYCFVAIFYGRFKQISALADLFILHNIMTSLRGKVVLVTGASAGIGKALIKRLIDAGSIVVGCSRNIEELQKIADELNVSGPKKMYPVKCDVTQEESIANVFEYVEKHCGRLHALVNNAGIALPEPLLSGTRENWMKMLETNVMSVAMGTREAVKLMRKCGVDNGHILNVNSLSGHRVVNDANIHFYSATKYAVTALTEGLRQELRNENSHIRVTQISPGVVRTEFAARMYDSTEKADEVYTRFEVMEADDVAEGIMYALQAHPRVNVSDILVRPTEQAA